MHRGHTPLEIDLRPLEPRHVALAKSGREREAGHLGDVLGQLLEQPVGLLAREPADPPRGSGGHVDGASRFPLANRRPSVEHRSLPKSKPEVAGNLHHGSHAFVTLSSKRLGARLYARAVEPKGRALPHVFPIAGHAGRSDTHHSVVPEHLVDDVHRRNCIGTDPGHLPHTSEH